MNVYYKNNNIIILIQPSRKLLNERDNLFTNESLVPSLGIGMLAASCRQSDLKVEILDLRLRHNSLELVTERIKITSPVFVGISAFTDEIVAAGILAKTIKEIFPSLPIVIGGPHASMMPTETLKEFKNFDIAVMGEGEETILDIAKVLINGNKYELENIPGVALRMDNGEIKLNNARDAIEDIDKLPLPAWDLFEIPLYNRLFAVSTSRGCPYDCYFCAPHYLGKKVRVKSPFKVVDEIQYLVDNFGAKRIQFADAALSLLGERTFTMCDEIIRRGLNQKIEWDCETRADSLDLKLLKKMKEAGCRWIALGVETGSERILNEVIKKKETKEQIRQARTLARQAGLRVRGFFILGHYTETTDTIKETINFALELNPDALSFGLIVPNPGTELRELAEKNSGGMKILNNNWQSYNQFNYDCFELENLSLNELKKWQAKAYFTFYRYHPIKALNLFLDKSGYNYKLKTLFKIIPQFIKKGGFVLA